MSNDIQYRQDTAFHLTHEQTELLYNLRDKNVCAIARRLNLSDTAVRNRFYGVTPVTLYEFEIICQMVGLTPGQVIRCEAGRQLPIGIAS